MSLKFTHDGQTIDVDLDNLAAHEGLAIQRATGKRLPEFLAALEAGDAEAVAALGWVLIKFRVGKADVTFDDVCEGRTPFGYKDLYDPDAPAPDPTAAAKVKTPT